MTLFVVSTPTDAKSCRISVSYTSKIAFLHISKTNMEERVTIYNCSKQQDFHQALARDVFVGITANSKWFPTKYLYDEQGAALYETIVRDKIYYPYQAETEILLLRAKEIVQLTCPEEVVELGSGTAMKTRPLLEAMRSIGCSRYVPLDISESTLRLAAAKLATEYTWLHVDGFVGDFDADLPKIPKKGRRLVVFLGSTIGNFSNTERRDFFGKLSSTMESDDSLLLGIDLFKSPEVILAGYADDKGLRRQFYLRALKVMNSQLGANFVEEKFTSLCAWNPLASSLEFSLVATDNFKVNIKDLDVQVTFSKGEDIRVAYSTKFTKEGINQELAGVGFDVTAWYTDTKEQFAEVLAVKCAKP